MSRESNKTTVDDRVDADLIDGQGMTRDFASELKANGLMMDTLDLQTLNLTGTQATDKGVRHLAGLTRLRKLVLAATTVSDAALMHLTKLAELDELNLHSSPD